MVKSVLVTYALWAVGGPLGLHHLYLERDSHALLWMLTLGGFGVGWAREIIRIPAYVHEANKDAEKIRRKHSIAGPPPAGPFRFAGQVCVGIYFGVVAMIGLKSLSFFYLIVLPLSVGAGVHLVSSAGEQTTDLQKTLTACLITSTIFYGSTLSPLPISLVASVTAAQHRRYKPPPAPGTRQELGKLTSHCCTLKLNVVLKLHLFLSFEQVRDFTDSVLPGWPSPLHLVTAFFITPRPHCTTFLTVLQPCWTFSGSCRGSEVWWNTCF